MNMILSPCTELVDYFYSSAGFYESGENNFEILNHIGNAL
jgi:hypothetical protein